MPLDLNYCKHNCDIDSLKTFLDSSFVQIITEARERKGERKLEGPKLLRLTSQPEANCDHCIRFGAVYFCDSQERAEAYVRNKR